MTTDKDGFEELKIVGKSREVNLWSSFMKASNWIGKEKRKKENSVLILAKEKN